MRFPSRVSDHSVFAARRCARLRAFRELLDELPDLDSTGLKQHRGHREKWLQA